MNLMGIAGAVNGPSMGGGNLRCDWGVFHMCVHVRVWCAQRVCVFLCVHVRLRVRTHQVNVPLRAFTLCSPGNAWLASLSTFSLGTHAGQTVSSFCSQRFDSDSSTRRESRHGSHVVDVPHTAPLMVMLEQTRVMPCHQQTVWAVAHSTKQRSGLQ